MEGLKMPRKRPNERGLTSTGRASSERRTGRAASRKPEEPKLVTTDTGIGRGRTLANPDAPIVWTGRVMHRTRGFVRSISSNCSTYVDANDAALDMLHDYLEDTLVHPSAWKHYECDTKHVETGETGGAEGRSLK